MSKPKKKKSSLVIKPPIERLFEKFGMEYHAESCCPLVQDIAAPSHPLQNILQLEAKHIKQHVEDRKSSQQPNSEQWREAHDMASKIDKDLILKFREMYYMGMQLAHQKLYEELGSDTFHDEAFRQPEVICSPRVGGTPQNEIFFHQRGFVYLQPNQPGIENAILYHPRMVLELTKILVDLDNARKNPSGDDRQRAEKKEMLVKFGNMLLDAGYEEYFHSVQLNLALSPTGWEDDKPEKLSDFIKDARSGLDFQDKRLLLQQQIAQAQGNEAEFKALHDQLETNDPIEKQAKSFKPENFEDTLNTLAKNYISKQFGVPDLPAM